MRHFRLFSSLSSIARTHKYPQLHSHSHPHSSALRRPRHLPNHYYPHHFQWCYFSIPSTTTASQLDKQISKLLTDKLSPTHLEVEDTSGGCGAFFRLLVVSPSFEGISMVKQHRQVNELLRDITKNIHGLTLVTKTPKQYENERKKEAQQAVQEVQRQ